MLQIKTKVGARGQIVIPKIIRESLGIVENKSVLLEVDNKSLRLIPSEGGDIIKSWKEIAKNEGTDVSRKLTYGDKIYEEAFK